MRLLALLSIFAVSVLIGCSSSKKTIFKPVSNSFQEPIWDDNAPRDGRFSHEKQPDPDLMEDACALLIARPHWAEALKIGQKVWEVDPWYILAFMHQESRFKPTALSKSRAYGFPQAKDATWAWYQEKRGRWNVSRERFDDAVDFIGWYAHQNVARNHVDLHDVRNQYLAYHEGLGGFERASYLAKPWLLKIADKVVDRALLYQAQLITCPVQYDVVQR